MSAEWGPGATPDPGRAARRAGFLRAALLVAVTIPLLVPLLQPGWLQTHEGFSNPIRQSQTMVCWRDGMPSARWFPDLNYGQGYPFLSFYAPLVFYLAGLFQLAGASVTFALKMPVLIGTVAGVGGAYRLTRRSAGPSGAFAAAVLYAYAPYHVRDLFIRGDLSEYVALGFLPWALWAVLGLREPNARRVAWVILTGALAILTHNILGLFTGLAMAATGAVTVLAAPDRRRTAIAAVLGGAGALLVTAFFWAPALYEKRFVQIDILTTGYYEFTDHFVGLAQLVGPGEFPTALSQALPMTPEIGYALLAGLALFVAFGVREARRAIGRETLVVAAGLLLVGLLMMTRLSAPIYRAAPLLQFVQFPWRFLALVILGASVLGGVGLDAALRRFGTRWIASGAAALGLSAILLAMPLLTAKRNFELPAWTTDPAELRRQRETTTAGEYLPLAAQEPRAPRRFERGARVFGEGRVVSGERKAGRYDLVLQAEEPVTVHLRDVAYPGWTAAVDGANVPLEAAEGTGNLRFSLDPGRHEVRVRLEPTPVRRAARLASLGSALLIAAALGGAFLKRGRRP